MQPELLPCPHCGKIEPVELWDASLESMELGGIGVVCNVLKDGCGAMGGHGDTEDEAIAAWNRRPSGWLPMSTCPNYVGILVAYGDGSVEAIQAADNDFVWRWDYGKKEWGITKPIAWQPLPPPPTKA